MIGSALIVEDHPLFRDALRGLMQRIFGEAGTYAEASAEEGLRTAAHLTGLRLVLLDMGLPGMCGTEAIAEFRRLYPDAALIAVSASEDRREVAAAFRVGARAFISKAVSTEAIVSVVRRMMNGEVQAPEWLCADGASAASTPDDDLPDLTPRQREILGLLSQGHSNKEIGLRLNVAEITVKQHVSALFRALGVVNRTQAVLVARQLGLSSSEAPIPPAGSLPPSDSPALAATLAELHVSLYNLGRLDEADEVFHRIEPLQTDLVRLARATGVQVCSLTNRGRHAQALALALAMLRRVGLAVPEDLAAEVSARRDGLLHWASNDSAESDLSRPEPSDARVLAIAELINRSLSPAFYTDRTAYAWLLLESQRLWDEYGPCSWLVATLGVTPVVTLALCGDYRMGYDTVRRVLAVGEARGYEFGTARAMDSFSRHSQHWFEPLEDVLSQARCVRERLLRSGDNEWAGYAYGSAIQALLDCAPTLDLCLHEVEAAITFAQRTAHAQIIPTFLAYRQLGRCLRDETFVAGEFDDADFNAAAHADSLLAHPVPLARFHVYRALAAAIFGDTDGLARHVTDASSCGTYLSSMYSNVVLMLLRALAFSNQARAAQADQRGPLLAELHQCRLWFTERAADAPHNYQHLAHWVDAEHAWACGDTLAASALFDRTLLVAETRTRPWHRALATERAAALHHELGRGYAARRLLLEAQELYAAWGAGAKVQAMQRARA